MSDEAPKNWKLMLRYGRLKTPFAHFTVLGEGVVGELSGGFSCPPGGAWMGMKTWASSAEESEEMLYLIGEQIGFEVTGHVYVYDTEPTQPPRDVPYGYEINFTPIAERT